jgi:hypothetical protein
MVLLKRKQKYIDGALYRLCACGHCNKYFVAGKTSHRTEQKFIHGHNSYGLRSKKIKPIPNHHPCECGCGQLVTSDKKYVSGHNSYKNGYYEILNEAPLCACGCGEKVNMGKYNWNEYIIYHHIPFEHPSEETLQKMRKPRSEKGKENIRLALARPEVQIKMSGENCHLWKGGIYLPYTEDWTNTLKEAIKQRDNYQCQLCLISQEESERKLDVHHIDYNKNNCDPNNLITLCRSCHSKTNYKREKWVIFFEGRKILQKKVINE